MYSKFLELLTATKFCTFMTTQRIISHTKMNRNRKHDPPTKHVNVKHSMICSHTKINFYWMLKWNITGMSKFFMREPWSASEIWKGSHKQRAAKTKIMRTGSVHKINKSSYQETQIKMQLNTRQSSSSKNLPLSPQLLWNDSMNTSSEKKKLKKSSTFICMSKDGS